MGRQTYPIVNPEAMPQYPPFGLLLRTVTGILLQISEPPVKSLKSLTTMDAPSPDDLAALIAELEIECARLRTVEAAAKEARAFLEGRRPGFAASYALDVLKAALTGGEKEAKAFPVIRGRWNARGGGRRKR